MDCDDEEEYASLYSNMDNRNVDYFSQIRTFDDQRLVEGVRQEANKQVIDLCDGLRQFLGDIKRLGYWRDYDTSLVHRFLINSFLDCDSTRHFIHFFHFISPRK